MWRISPVPWEFGRGCSFPQVLIGGTRLMLAPRLALFGIRRSKCTGRQKEKRGNTFSQPLKTTSENS
jgi:hypothetical protein